MKEFFVFIREQGIVGLAIGFILGGAVSGVVSSLVTDIIQPLVGMVFGSTEGLHALAWHSVMYGKFLAVLIDFTIVAFVVFFIFKKLKLDRLDVKNGEKGQDPA